ncbi:mCG124558 [Mus musculus]|nr:mCG124558 [Mus musculus]
MANLGQRCALGFYHTATPTLLRAGAPAPAARPLVGRVLITHPRTGVVRAKADFEKVAVGLRLERPECDCGAGGAEGSSC